MQHSQASGLTIKDFTGVTGTYITTMSEIYREKYNIYKKSHKDVSFEEYVKKNVIVKSKNDNNAQSKIFNDNMILSAFFLTNLFKEKDGKRAGKGKLSLFDLLTLKPEDVTREIAEDLIANPIFVTATQFPHLTQRATGIPVADIYYEFGFVIDSNGIYHERQEDSVQSFTYSGYNDFYDTVFYYGTHMDKAKFEFSDGEGNDYVLWVWKGDYLNLGAGAEMAIYRKMEVLGYETEHYLVDQSLSMPMTLDLVKDGKTIISYNPVKDDPSTHDSNSDSTDKWWVTGFNPKYQDVDEDDLTATFTVDFTNNPELYEGFLESKEYLRNPGAWTPDDNNQYKLTFSF